MKLFRSHLKKQQVSSRQIHSHQSPQTRKKRLPSHRVMFTEQHSQEETQGKMHSITTNNVNISSIDSLAKQGQTIQSRVLEDAAHYLQVNFQPEVNGYLINKFRKYVDSKNSARKKKTSIFRSQIYQENSTISYDIMENQSHLTCNSCRKVMKRMGSNERIIVEHAKQKILRLVQLKKKKQQELERVAESIKSRSLKTQKKRRHKNLDMHMPQLEQELWDKQWRVGATLELKRYRTRIMTKNRKSERIAIKFTGLQ